MRKIWTILNYFFIPVFLNALYTSLSLGNMMQSVKYGLFLLTCLTEVLLDKKVNDKGLITKIHYTFIFLLLLWLGFLAIYEWSSV